MRRMAERTEEEGENCQSTTLSINLLMLLKNLAFFSVDVIEKRIFYAETYENIHSQGKELLCFFN